MFSLTSPPSKFSHQIFKIFHILLKNNTANKRRHVQTRHTILGDVMMSDELTGSRYKNK